MATQIFTTRFSILIVIVLAISSYSTYAIYNKTETTLDYTQYDESIDAGLELTINGNHSEAFVVFFPLAEKGVPRAKLYLAVSYYHGRGVERDVDVAKNLFFELQQESYEPHIISTYLNLINSIPKM